jgi:hypothetical protein
MANRVMGIFVGVWNSIRHRGMGWLQVTVVILWSLWIGREYLDFHPRAWPTGEEVIMTTQSHYLWEAVKECGACFLWNGATKGGIPAFVDVHGAPYHPMVIVSTLLFGVMNGNKLALILSLMIAGFAQLWLGRILKLNGWIALWCALMAVAGGHLAGKMDNGVVPLVISTACCSLVIPGLLQFLTQGSRRNTVILAAVIASAILAGQGYVQIGFVLSILPAFLILALTLPSEAPFAWRRFGIAIGLSLLITAFFLLPLLRFLPNWMKNGDPNFSSAQPISYLPLNLVINDWQFLDNPLLQKLPSHVYFYTNYIGWVPVLLAILSLILLPPSRRRILYFSIACIVLVFLAASADTFKLLSGLDPNMLGLIQNPPLIAGLVIPFFLMLAGLALQHLLVRDWPSVTMAINLPDSRPFVLSVKYTVLALTAIVLLAALRAEAVFTELFYRTVDLGLTTQVKVLDAMETEELEWIQPPWAEYFWLPLAEARGMKIADFVRPWFWRDQPLVQARYFALREDKPDYLKISEIKELMIFIDPNAHYAALTTENEDIIPCQATGWWGDLDVHCVSETPGLLTLQEYYWDGWYGEVDNQPDSILEEKFLSVEVPSGDHIIHFRYRPWDVWIGLLISGVGVLMAGIYWYGGRKETPPSSTL